MVVLIFILLTIPTVNATSVKVTWIGSGFLCLSKGSSCSVTVEIIFAAQTVKKLEANKGAEVRDVPITFLVTSNEKASDKNQTTKNIDLSWKQGSEVVGKDEKGNEYILTFGSDRGKFDEKTKMVSLTLASIKLKKR